MFLTVSKPIRSKAGQVALRQLNGSNKFTLGCFAYFDVMILSDFFDFIDFHLIISFS
jgi:hypothetical protein